jgi:transcriptional regulator with XRE-family HTH domain
VGRNVAAVRKARGLSQLELAGRAQISYSLLTKIESEHAPATPAVIGALARALRVDVPRLTGQPYEAASATSPEIYEPVTALRHLLLAYDVPIPPQVPSRPLERIAAAVSSMSALRRAANFKHLAASLPPLVEEMRFLALTLTGSERERALRLLAEVYYGVECLGSGVGYQDIYLLAIERVSWCADQLGDPLLIAAARWGRAGPLMREGAYEAGLRLLAYARDDLGDATDDAQAMTGSLHLREALLAGRDGRPGDAYGHLDAARELADRLGETDLHDLAFGPSGTVMYEISVAVDLGDGVRAVDAARSHTGPLDLAPELLGCTFIDLARGYLLVGDRAAALRSLQQARHAAPQQTRHHPQTRETVLAIASGGRGSEELTAFASWLGLS